MGIFNFWKRPASTPSAIWHERSEPVTFTLAGKVRTINRPYLVNDQGVSIREVRGGRGGSDYGGYQETTFEYREDLADGSSRSFEVKTSHYGIRKNSQENNHEVLLGLALRKVPWQTGLSLAGQVAFVRRCKRNLREALMQWPNVPTSSIKVIPAKRVRFYMGKPSSVLKKSTTRKLS